MAKQSLPSVDEDDAKTLPQIGDPYPSNEVEQPLKKDDPKEEGSESLRPYASIDTRLTKAFHRRQFRDKYNELINSNATLMDGSPVSHKTDVLKWFLENCV